MMGHLFSIFMYYNMYGNELLGGDLLSPSTQKYISLFIANNVKLQYIQQTIRVTYSETLGGSV